MFAGLNAAVSLTSRRVASARPGRAGRLAIPCRIQGRSVMSVRAYRTSRGYLLLGSALLALIGLGGAETAPSEASRGRRLGSKTEAEAAARARCRARTGGAGHAGRAAQRQGRRLRSMPQQSLHDHRHVLRRHHPRDHRCASRRRQPDGGENPVAGPGVSQDSAASGLLHVRNDHANVQYRFNGVMLPDGVTGFGSILDASVSAASP